MAPPSKYTPEFREEAVQIALRSNRTISETAREIEVNPETLRGWVKKYQRQTEPVTGAPLTLDERARLKEQDQCAKRHVVSRTYTSRSLPPDA
ncbi:transposase [Streptomyces sp. NPDC055085]